ncbi:hypothetical protein [Neorhizobium sp. T25_13]|uniref:hypothetical protein n=1 Tax=Neorhizobium sp. T25_13 TaxID=2093830 RepID=UPI000CF86D43|nr:hypothetical protein [Neorhizobium sp. T25_13]
MKDLDDEIERIASTLAALEKIAGPSPELKDLIDYYRDRHVKLSRKSAKYFTPYRNERGRLVVNEVGDTEDDI